MVKRREGSLKARCKDYYQQSTCEDKVQWTTFYWRVKVRPEIPREISICCEGQPRKKQKPRWWRWAEELAFYDSWQGEKPLRHIFYGRLVRGWTKEEAITIWEEAEKVKNKKPHAYCNKPYTPTYTRLEEDETQAEYTGIDITYPADVAKVFRKEFYNVIDGLENQIRMSDDKECIKQLNEKLELVEAELKVFNSYNK